MARTTHRGKRGKKLYAKRKGGKFTDVQRYKRAHGSTSSAAPRLKEPGKRNSRGRGVLVEPEAIERYCR